MGSSGQLYSLSWGEFGSSLASAVQLLRGHGDLVDVTLAAGGRSFPAHKIVLSAASPFLLDLLKSTPCQHPVVMLAGIDADDLETLLEFVYRGEVNVESSQLPSLLQAANCLNINGLTPPTLKTGAGDEVPSAAESSSKEPAPKETANSTTPLRRRKRKRKSSSSSPGKWQRTSSTSECDSRTADASAENRTSDFDSKEDESANHGEGREQRETEPMNRRSPSPSTVRVVTASENHQHQDPASDSESPHSHPLVPLQPYSPLHIPQFAASLGIGFPNIPCLSQNPAGSGSVAAGAASGKIRGASDCPGVCPLCGATLRQARNLRRHLLSSCKYRLGSFMRNPSPSDSMMIEVKPEVDISGYAGSATEDSNSCEQIVCKPSPLPSPSGRGSSVVSPHSNVSSPTVAR